MTIYPRQRWTRQSRHNFLWGLLFTFPVIIGLLWFMVYPVVISFYYSFTSYSILGNYKWIGSSNYSALLEDQNFWLSLYNLPISSSLPFP